MNRFEIHTHSVFSNLRLLDCINNVEDLIETAQKQNLLGVCLTDHESLGGHVIANKIAKKLKEKNSKFKIGLGDEIYLTDTREVRQKYYHFILVAKDAVGHKMLRELSSNAWINSYYDYGERVPTLKSELKEKIEKYGKGHLIASTACLGGELSTKALELSLIEDAYDDLNKTIKTNEIQAFLNYCLDLFDGDFYIECAPGCSKEQIIVNKKLRQIAKKHNIKMIIGTDAHYLKEQDRYTHKAFLTSDTESSDREVDAFYEYSYLQTEEEIIKHLTKSYDVDFIKELFDNSVEIYNKIEFYDLYKKQSIPQVQVKDYPKDYYSCTNYEFLHELFISDDIQERYWVNSCIDELKRLNLYNNTYLNRLNEEADILSFIGRQLETNMYSYPITLQHYINLLWDCGGIVGPGRGSACGGLNHYLLGITQLDPIKWDLPFFRYLNKERAELGDIDIDLPPSVRPAVFEAIRKERGELGLVQVATYGTASSKAAIQTACRGYRSEEYPEGIDVDIARYLSSLIPVERGFSWSISDMLNGNEEKGRKPNKLFIKEIAQYPGLLEIVINLEGVIKQRGIHASGIILYGDDPYETTCFMKTKNGDMVTQYDLHDCEYCGDCKFDFLVTEVSDKIIQCINLLIKHNVIENDSLRNIYNKYLHPSNMDLKDQRIWDALGEGQVLDVFQFSTGTGLAAAKRLKPQNPIEMCDANALMRLMADKGEENPIDKYYRFKNDISLWYDEMETYGLTREQQEVLEKYYLSSYGVPPLQEQLMTILMDKDICNFTLGEANAARKIVAKKKMDEIPKLKEKIFDKAVTPEMGLYVWDTAVKTELGYAFSKNHSLPYSFVGIQTLILAVKFNPIYWSTACLIVNSGATDPDNKGTTDYEKIAKAIGDIKSHGIEVTLVDINKSSYEFEADGENNCIRFGLKALLKVGDGVIDEIVENRPYESLSDFMNKTHISKQPMISLIKGGAFDSLEDRKIAMGLYLWHTCNKKKRLTLQNMRTLIKYNLLPNDLEKEKATYNYNSFLKKYTKANFQGIDYYTLNDEYVYNFFINNYNIDYVELISENNIPSVSVKNWEKIYKIHMDKIREWLQNNKDTVLYELNKNIFLEEWKKNASGTISAWEMEALCFYYHEHELQHIQANRYGIVDFFSLPEDPKVEKTFQKGNATINIYEINKICGTCIAKNKTKGIATLLTPTGVVNVKFRKEYFSLFDKQISEKQEDGTKKVKEASWFNKGSMIIVQGFRRGDDFIAKKYSKTPGHQLYKITSIDDKGEITLQTERYGEGE